MGKMKAISILNNAIINVPYYREKSAIINMKRCTCEEDFDSFPVLKKADIQASNLSIISDEYAGLLIKSLRVERTSGSTGRFINVYWNKDEYNSSNMILWRLRKKWYDITPNSKCVSFNSVLNSGSNVYLPESNSFSYNKRRMYISKFVLDDNNILEVVNSINAYKPEWMIIQSSSLTRLTLYLIENNMKIPSLRYIELNGEVVTEIDRKVFEDFYNVPLANMYGAVEVNSIAYECPYHNIHILEDNVYLENQIIDNKSTILVTSLHNNAMPIIKYEIGDEVELGNVINCRCGTKSRTIKRIIGRSADTVKVKNGDYVNPYIFTYCIEKTNSVFNGIIKQFKVIQLSFTTIAISLCVEKSANNWSNAIKEQLLSLLRQNCKQYNFEFEIEISNLFDFDNTTGKYKLFECQI